MVIKSIKFSDILSFGPEPQEIFNIKKMNLFIGVNGSGKSNVLRMLGDIDCDYVQTSQSSMTPVNQTDCAKFSVRLGIDFIPSRYTNREIVDAGNLEIVFSSPHKSTTNIKYSGGDEPKDYVVKFLDRSLIAGDPALFSPKVGNVKYVTSDWSDAKFIESLSHLQQGEQFHEFSFLIFGLRYIFQRDYIVSYFGGLEEASDSESSWISKIQRSKGFEKIYWPDGVLRVAKIIQQINRGSDVVLLEEPELGLEPRVLRRLFCFLLWLGTPDIAEPGTSEIVKTIELSWNDYCENVMKKSLSSTLDPDNLFVPLRQAKQYF